MKIKAKLRPNLLVADFFKTLIELRICGEHFVDIPWPQDDGTTKISRLYISSDTGCARYVRLVFKRKYGYDFRPRVGKSVF